MRQVELIPDVAYITLRWSVTIARLGGATVARLTPVQKVACSNHVRVKAEVLNTLRDGGRSRIETIPQASEREPCSSLKMQK